MLAPSDQTFLAARVETARIINVNISDWSVDVVTEFGDKKYFDIQIGMSYFHYANGEGIYVVPEVGAYVWVCNPSSGIDATPFIIAFQSPFDEGSKSYRSNRADLNPGDIMMKTRDENFITLRRGGVVQIGSTPSAQRMYIPIRNTINDFCENYNLRTIAGAMQWTVHRDEKTTSGEALTEFQLKVREKANDPEPIAKLTVGSPDGEEGVVKFRLEIMDKGDGGEVQVLAELDKEGNISLVTQGNYSATIEGNAEVNINGDALTTVEGTATYTSKGDAVLESTNGALIAKALSDATMESSANANVKAAANVNVEGVKINLGGAAAYSPVVKGTELASFLSTLLTHIAAFQCPCSAVASGLAAVPGGAATPLTAGMLAAAKPVVAAPAVGTLTSQIPSLLSQTSYTK